MPFGQAGIGLVANRGSAVQLGGVSSPDSGLVNGGTGGVSVGGFLRDAALVALQVGIPTLLNRQTAPTGPGLDTSRLNLDDPTGGMLDDLLGDSMLGNLIDTPAPEGCIRIGAPAKGLWKKTKCGNTAAEPLVMQNGPKGEIFAAFPKRISKAKLRRSLMAQVRSTGKRRR